MAESGKGSLGSLEALPPGQQREEASSQGATSSSPAEDGKGRVFGWKRWDKKKERRKKKPDNDDDDDDDDGGDDGGDDWPEDDEDRRQGHRAGKKYLPSQMKQPPDWPSGMTYKDYRKLLLHWSHKASQHFDESNFGYQLLQSTKIKTIRQVLIELSTAQLDDWLFCLNSIDREFGWTNAGEGYMRWHEFIHHQKSGKAKDGMEDFLLENSQRRDRMHELLFPPLTCPRCSCGIPHGLPSQVRGLILLDAANLDESQEEMVINTTGGEDAPPTHDEVKAKLKKLCGRERRQMRRNGQSVNIVDDGDDAQEEAEWENEEGDEEGEEEEGYWSDENGNEFWLGPDEKEASTIYIAVGTGKERKWKPLQRKGGPVKKHGGGSPSTGGAKPSAENPCRICGSPDHWGNECPQNPNKGKGKAKGKGRRKGRGRKPGSVGVATSTTPSAVAATTLTGAAGAASSSVRRDGDSSSSSGETAKDDCSQSGGEATPAEALTGAANKPVTTSSGLAPRQGILDNGATRVVMGLKEFKRWIPGNSKTGDPRIAKKSFSDRFYKFGDGRILNALFRGTMPTCLGGYRGWPGGHVVRGPLGTLVADPALGMMRACVDYWDYPRTGKPEVTLCPPGKPDVRMEVPVLKSPAGHWTIDLDCSTEEVKFVPVPERRVAESCGVVGCHPGDGVEKSGVVPAFSAALEETTQSPDASVAVTAEASVVEKEGFADPSQTASILSTPSALSSQVAGVAREVRSLVQKVAAPSTSLSSPSPVPSSSGAYPKDDKEIKRLRGLEPAVGRAGGKLAAGVGSLLLSSIQSSVAGLQSALEASSPLSVGAALGHLQHDVWEAAETAGMRDFFDEVCREVGNSRRSELCTDRRAAEATKRFHESVGVAHAEISPLPSGKFVVTDPEKKLVLPSVGYSPPQLRSIFGSASAAGTPVPVASAAPSVVRVPSGLPPTITTGSMPSSRTDAFHPQHLYGMLEGAEPWHSLEISSGTSALWSGDLRSHFLPLVGNKTSRASSYFRARCVL